MSDPLELELITRSKSENQFNLDPKFRTVLQELGITQIANLTIDQLTEILEKISAANITEKNDKKRLANEDLHCAIMQNVAQHLKNNYLKKDPQPDSTQKSSSHFRKKVLFWLLIILHFIPPIIGGFLGIRDLLNLIPGIPNIIADIGAAITCAIESLLFYAVMSPMFRRALGIPEIIDVDVFVQSYTEQLEATQQINEALTKEIYCADKITPQLYSKYKNFSKVCNQKILTIQKELPEFKESTYKKIIRWGFTGINHALTIAGVYYMVNTLLLAVAAPLVGTPIGWAIIAALIIGQMAGSFALRNDGMFYMLNPKAQRHHSLKMKLESFEDKSLELEMIFEKKAKTITTPIPFEEVNEEFHKSFLYPRNSSCGLSIDSLPALLTEQINYCI